MNGTKLTAEQLKGLREALGDAYEVPELQRLIAESLRDVAGGVLEDITTAPNKTQIVFELVQTAERRGWIEDLIREAYRSNPRNPSLLAFWEGVESVVGRKAENVNVSEPTPSMEGRPPSIDNLGAPTDPRKGPLIPPMVESPIRTSLSDARQELSRIPSESSPQEPKQLMVRIHKLEKLRNHQRNLERWVKGYMRARELFDPSDRIRGRLQEARDDPQFLSGKSFWKDFQERLEPVSSPVQSLRSLHAENEWVGSAADAFTRAVRLVKDLRWHETDDERTALRELADAIEELWDSGRSLSDDFQERSDDVMAAIQELLNDIFNPIDQTEGQRSQALANSAGTKATPSGGVAPRAEVSRVDPRRSESAVRNRLEFDSTDTDTQPPLTEKQVS